MPYTLKFSDPAKVNTVVVPDMPPGINSVDTSLNLVGRGYPNYGLKYAENFLHLLENFASALPPENPIEGQLWYDTSNPSNKVLRIMDGTAGSTRWPNANGIYQQSVNPKDSNTSGLKIGDIWVDTANNQLKIFNSNDWTLIGPQTAGGKVTGQVPELISDVLGVDHWIIKEYVDSDVVSVITNATFTPRTTIAGFSALKAGVNIAGAGVLNGTSLASQNLEISNVKYSASTFLRKNDQSATGQLITGKVVFQSPVDQSGSQNRDGLIVNTGNTAEYIQLYKLNNDAVLLNNKLAGKIIFKTRTGSGNALGNVLSIDNGVVGINTATTAASPTLDVYGTTRILSTLTVLSSANTAINVSGGISVGRDISITGNLAVSGITANSLVIGTSSGSGSAILPANSDTYDIGSASMPIRSVFASRIGSTGTIIYGTVTGSATGLSQSSTFKLQGQVTATSFVFAGTGTEATFNSTLTRDAIAAQSTLTVTADTLTLMVLDTSTTTTSLQQISKKNFLSDVYFSGMMVVYGGTVAPTGWLLCDGSTYTTSSYPGLFAIIGTTYGGSGGSFKVPRFSSTDADAHSVKYIIKI